MDALSDLLRVVRLSGGVFLEAEFTAPWCIASQIGPEDCRMVLAEPQAVVAFHYVIAGKLFLQTPGEKPVEVKSGAIVLLPRNDPHTLASEPGLPPANSHDLIETHGDLARIHYGGGGEETRIVCGFVGTEARQTPLIDALPPMLVLDLSGKPSGEWVASAFRYAAAELSAVRAGSAIALAKLSELLFVEAVRHHIETLPAERRGWLAGLRDPAVGRALALLHTQLARSWTAETLAREVCLSRSAFAERFTALIGVPPMKYLTSWRMQVAAQRLREGHRSVAQVAADVGYESEAAFTRAFKREFPVSPARWRKQLPRVNEEGSS
jgi:AraC-like DNA-binding protein